MNADRSARMPAIGERRELLDELRSTVRALLERESSSARVRELLDDELGHDPALWKQMAELGWLGLAVPEDWGGSGAGELEAMLVAEELGRHLTPSPFLGSAVLTSRALLLARDDRVRDRWLARLVDGSARGAAALTGADGRVGRAVLGVHATAKANAHRLNGEAGFAPDAVGADLLVVAADSSDGVVITVIEPGDAGVTVEAVETVDHTRRLATVSLDGVEVPPENVLAEGVHGVEVLRDLVTRGAVAVAADSAGGARRALELAVDYVKEREQFGRKVGSFQAVKHHCADMLIRVEGASAAVQSATDALEHEPAAVPAATAVAKAYAGDAAVAVAGDAIQVHGGVGFTWEFDCHLYLKRALLGRALLGDSRHHRETLASTLDPRTRS